MCVCVHMCVSLYLCQIVPVRMQLLVKDLEQMFDRPSLEVHALLVWRHYVNLLGTVSYSSFSVFRLYCNCCVSMQGGAFWV